MLEVKLFGVGEVRYLSKKVNIPLHQLPGQLFCYLLLNRDHVHNREHLAAVFWPDVLHPCKPFEDRIFPIFDLFISHVLIMAYLCKRSIEFYSDPGIPWINNRTEQIIRRLKSRAKRVRGYKNSQGQLMGSLVASQF